MAFTLVINSKGLFGKVKSIQMAELLKNCGLKYGSNNEFYILEDDKMNQNTAVLYNAKRTGRGIFLMEAGLLTDRLRSAITFRRPKQRSMISYRWQGR